MMLSRGSAFYDSVEYMRLQDSGLVSLEESGKRTRIQICLGEVDWIEIRNTLDGHNSVRWQATYSSSEIPSDQATHIVIEFPDMKVDTYNRFDSAPEVLGIEGVYDEIKAIILRRSEERQSSGKRTSE